FGAHGLVPFEPALLGAAARPWFEGALRDDGAIARALREGADALRARGLEPPLPVDDDPPLFLIEAGARTRVHCEPRENARGNPRENARGNPRENAHGNSHEDARDSSREVPRGAPSRAGGLYLGAAARPTARDELLAHATHGVPRLSANVALRPILQ